MSSFAPFAAAVKKQFDKMSKGELYSAGTGRAVWDAYIAAFPEGTNPIYLTRTEHDCECCKQFVRGIGNAVSIVDGKRVSVWDLEGLESPYAEVAAALSKYVAEQPITGVYRMSEKKYGARMTIQDLGAGQSRQWNHFHGDISTYHRSDTVEKARSIFAGAAEAFERGLTELNPAMINVVVDLIADKNLYRGEEYLTGMLEFRALQQQYLALPTDIAKNTFVWQHAENRKASMFRSNAMGDMIVNLSGTPASKHNKWEEKPAKSLEDSVGLFEFIHAPENFKRSKALTTPKMKEDALKFVNDEGWRDSLERRHARLSDISVNNVRWVDSTAQALMKDSLTAMLMAAPSKPVKADDSGAEDISIDDFLANVLPQVKSMELFVTNSQVNNFMSLTAPVVPDSKNMFKWGNSFGWSYTGNIADSSLRQRVQSAGGRIDGVLRFSHTWNYDARNASLMDLHVFMPGSRPHKDGSHDSYPGEERVGWNKRNHLASGGKQDVDYTDAAPVGYVPVENITFPTLSKLKDGDYTFKIHNWNFRPPTLGGFRAEIEFGGQLFQYDHPAPLMNKEWVTLAVATLKNGHFTIEHKHPVGAASQDMWGVKTETFVKVNTLLNSPNFWDENKVGNKHWFFVLDGCNTDEPTRGIYNEFLSADFEKHRKVFEVLGNLMQCPPTTDQMSGMGFSSTRGDKVVVKVSGDKMRKKYNIQF